MAEQRVRLMVRFFLMLQIIALTGCGVATQITCDLDYRNIGALSISALERDGIGVLTPSIVTGRETDKQIVGQVLSDVLEDYLAPRNVVTLAQLLNRINAAGLADSYAASLGMYDTSGILPQDTITQLGAAAGARFLAKLSLANFEQAQVERFGIAGIRVLSTNRTRIRLFLEIWDSDNGQIVWYANEELALASERATEEDLSVRGAATRAISEMLATILGQDSVTLSEESGDPICAPDAEPLFPADSGQISSVLGPSVAPI
jgi:hypothetical protein